LFFYANGHVFAVLFTELDGQPSMSTPVALFKLPGGRPRLMASPARDGQRFLTVPEDELNPAVAIGLIRGWPQLLTGRE
jgi:hypothetical protein